MSRAMSFKMYKIPFILIFNFVSLSAKTVYDTLFLFFDRFFTIFKPFTRYFCTSKINTPKSVDLKKPTDHGCLIL